MKRLLFVALAVLAVLALAPPVQAQNVANPTGFTFACSPDHAQAVKYQIAVFSPLVPSDPYHVYDVGIPTPVSGQCTVTVDMSNIPIGNGYFAKSRIWVDPTHMSPWSEAGPPFDKALSAPGAPTPIRQ